MRGVSAKGSLAGAPPCGGPTPAPLNGARPYDIGAVGASSGWVWPAYRTGRALDLLLSLLRMRRHQPIFAVFSFLFLVRGESRG